MHYTCSEKLLHLHSGRSWLTISAQVSLCSLYTIRRPHRNSNSHVAAMRKAQDRLWVPNADLPVVTLRPPHIGSACRTEQAASTGGLHTLHTQTLSNDSCTSAELDQLCEVLVWQLILLLCMYFVVQYSLAQILDCLGPVGWCVLLSRAYWFDGGGALTYCAGVASHDFITSFSCLSALGITACHPPWFLGLFIQGRRHIDGC
jgi:hypothetical protein